MKKTFKKILSCKTAFLSLIFTCYSLPSLSSENTYVGINLAGAEFNASVLPGKQGTNYIWPTPAEINQFADAGFNTLRIPFRWERLQPELNKPLNEMEANYLDLVISTAKKRDITIIIDVHNFGGYRDAMIGSEMVPVKSFEYFWSLIAQRYKKDTNVMFGLMNEPYKQKSMEWAKIAQTTIYAIRKTGANQIILVPGTRWSGAHSWLNKDAESSNADALNLIDDPAKNLIFEMHQYFDRDSSGTQPTCVNSDVGINRLTKATKWLKENNHKAILGEFGSSTDPTCLAALEKTLGYMKQNADVWAGWTYWAAGRWFGNYMFNIYPPNPLSPQLKVLSPYLRPSN